VGPLKPARSLRIAAGKSPGAQRYSLSLSPRHQHQQPGIEAGDEHGDEPGQRLQPAGVYKLAHHLAVAGKQNQRDDGKAELQRENYLAQNEQLLRALLTGEGDDEDRRDDGQRARDQPPQPRGDLQVDEAFHDNLSGEGSADG